MTVIRYPFFYGHGPRTRITILRRFLYGSINHRDSRFYECGSDRNHRAVYYFIKKAEKGMTGQAGAYFTFGLTLVVIFVVIIVHYYSKKRHRKVEEPKYKMLDDED